METDSTNRHLTQLCDEQGIDIRNLWRWLPNSRLLVKDNVATVGNRKMVKTLHSASYFTLHSLKRVNNSFFPSSSHSPQRRIGWMGWRFFHKMAEWHLLEWKEDLRHTDREWPFRTSYRTQHFRYRSEYQSGSLPKWCSQPGISKTDYKRRSWQISDTCQYYETNKRVLYPFANRLFR